MKAYIATGMIGTFAFDEQGKLVHYVLFRNDPALIAERVSDADKGEMIPEEEELVRDLIRSGYKSVAWDKKIDFPGISCMYEPDNPGKAALQKEMRSLALDLRFAENDAALNKLLSEVNVLITKKRLRKERKDAILMRAVSVVDELDRTNNTLSEMLREWYALYFPEAERLIRDHAQLAKAIHEEGERGKITDKKVAKYAEMTAGMPFSEDDLTAVQEYAKEIAALYNLRDSLVTYLRKTSKSYMPNLTAVAGPIIACRLLLLAGSLEKMAKLPSSTMQLLGAEKALFRHLKSSKDRPPKFGVIFAHPLIQNAQKDEKGKMARLLAAKLVMAARADFYTGKDISEKLLSDLNAKTSHVPREKQKSPGSIPGTFYPSRPLSQPRAQSRPYQGREGRPSQPRTYQSRPSQSSTYSGRPTQPRPYQDRDRAYGRPQSRGGSSSYAPARRMNDDRGSQFKRREAPGGGSSSRFQDRRSDQGGGQPRFHDRRTAQGGSRPSRPFVSRDSPTGGPPRFPARRPSYSKGPQRNRHKRR